jgi:hypothetical protein
LTPLFEDVAVPHAVPILIVVEEKGKTEARVEQGVLVASELLLNGRKIHKGAQGATPASLNVISADLPGEIRGHAGQLGCKYEVRGVLGGDCSIRILDKQATLVVTVSHGLPGPLAHALDQHEMVAGI